MTTLETLDILQVKPDIEYSGQELNGPLDYIHYNKGDINFYFVRNTTDEWLTKNVHFRQHNKVPELWDPVSGQQHSLPIYNRMVDQIEIPLTFKPYDSYFVVFTQGEEDSLWDEMINSEGGLLTYERTSEGYAFRETGRVQIQKDDQIREISSNFQSFPIEGEWQLGFPDNWGAPGSTVFPELISWTESDDEGIKYFSGIATYQKSFHLSFDPDTLSDDYRVYLSLGDLEKVGDTWLNGEALGISWAKPHEYDITTHIIPGENEITIEIANVWGNRIIGDARTGQGFTTTNITNVRGTPWEEVPLVTSGLLGPVNVELRRLFVPEE